MKIIRKIIPSLFLVVILTACNSFAPTPTMTVPTINPTYVMGTAISIFETKVALTQAAIPTATFPSSTKIPHPSPPPADNLDHAMTTAQKIYPLFPFINEVNLYGEYAGCTETNDFQNLVVYPVTLPTETIQDAFVNFFQTEGWNFVDGVSGDNHPNITYIVYRISSKDNPAFERLKVVLFDESNNRGTDYVSVRAEFTHIETKDNFDYLSSPFSQICPTAWWLWIRLNK